MTKPQPESAEARIEALCREVERLTVLASRERGLVESILNVSPYGIIVSDPHGKLILHNKAAERIWAGSASAETIEGWGKYRAFHPDGRPYQPDDWAMARCLRHGETVQPEEMHIQRFDDSHGTLLGSCAPIFGASGQLEGAVSIFADITEKRREEDRRRFIGEASTLLASSLDYAPTLTSVARLAVPIIADWCAVDIVEVGGKVARLAVAHIDPSKVRFAEEIEARYPADPANPYGVHEVIRTAKPLLMAEVPDQLLVDAAVDAEHLRLIRELGLRSAMIVPLRAHGLTLGALTFVSAESNRRFGPRDLAFAEEIASCAALAVNNARLYREAQRANQAKDEFLATVSHELRTPLSAILGWAQLLRSATLTDEKRAHGLETIERNARAQAQLIEDLLDVSRIISGQLRLDVRALDLVAIIEAAVDAVRLAADSKGIRLALSLDPAAALATGDHGRLQQIVWNLVSNAVKFTDRGGTVTVRLGRSGSRVEIEVSDNGAGIDPAFLPHVFERFRQADGRTTRAHGGLGLGLAIVRHLVELHGGTVEASSPGPGQGATFKVTLPVAAAVTGGGPVASRPANPMPRLDGLRVVVVDDELDARDMLTEILAGAGAEVEAVGSAAAALRAITARPPDVLVSDIGMPGEDGYALIRQVRDATRGLPHPIAAVALTAYARTEDRTRALLAGFQAHVAKPVEPDELVIVVATLAGRTG